MLCYIMYIQLKATFLRNYDYSLGSMHTIHLLGTTIQTSTQVHVVPVLLTRAWALENCPKPISQAHMCTRRRGFEYIHVHVCPRLLCTYTLAGNSKISHTKQCGFLMHLTSFPAGDWSSCNTLFGTTCTALTLRAINFLCSACHRGKLDALHKDEECTHTHND